MTKDTPFEYTPYQPRAVRYHGIRRHAGHRLKTYSVHADERPVDWAAFQEGVAGVLAQLPEADPAAGRPGLGFLIAHQGRDADYAVLCWWAHENELPTRVWLRDGSSPWRPAQEESFCVWDLDIMAQERLAYVETVLGRKGRDAVQAYLGRVASAPV